MTSDELKPIETQYDGRRFRSRTEARWAVFFNALGLEYQYEREGYDLNGIWYLPDFFLPAFPMWVEVKGANPTEQEIDLCRVLSAQTGQRVLLAIGAPARYASQFLQFTEGAQIAGKWKFLADRRNDGEYWLTSNSIDDAGYTGSSIGPVNGPVHDRFPLVHGRLEAALIASMSARFEHGEKG